MIKLYFVGIIGLFSVVWFGLDGYMTSKQLSWEQIWIVWPLWSLLMIVGFLVGGAVCGVIAQAAMRKESRAINKRADEKNEAYREQLSGKQALLIEQEKTLDKRVKMEKQELDERDERLDEKAQRQKEKIKVLKKEILQEAKEELEEAANIKANTRQVVIKIKAENKILQRSAFHATSTVKRLRRKIEKLQAKIEKLQATVLMPECPAGDTS